MQIFYKGVEISGTTKPSACVMRDSAGGEADALSVVFPDVSALWPGWGPERGDVMRYVNGDFDSGDLYVDNAAFTSGGFRVDAVSVPPEARRKNTRIWRKVRLSEIIGDIASRCGLTAKTYGITDYTYRAISQASEPDIAFLSRICLREGYAVKVSGGGLIVYAEKRMEAQPPALTIARADVRPGYLFYRGTGQLSSVTVSFCDAAAGETYSSRDESHAGRNTIFCHRESAQHRLRADKRSGDSESDRGRYGLQRLCPWADCHACGRRPIRRLGSQHKHQLRRGRRGDGRFLPGADQASAALFLGRWAVRGV